MHCVNQHFVPQYYLKNFSENGNVYVFDKKINKFLNNGNSLPVSKIGFEKNIYDAKPEILQVFCNPKIESEKFLDTLIEQYNERISAPLINSFINVGEEVHLNNDLKLISFIAKEDLIDFTIVQFVRTQRFKAFTEIFAKIIFDKLKTQNCTIRKFSLQELSNAVHNLFVISAIDNTQIWKRVNKTRILKTEYIFIDEFVNNITSQLRKMSKTLWVSGIAKYYKTSDTPILVAASENQKIENISFPITKRFCFTFSNHPEFDKEIIKVTEKNMNLIDKANEKIIQCAERFTYSYDKN
jgi:hypothetical protein